MTTLVLGCAAHPGLAAAVARARTSVPEVVLLTDDRDGVGPLPPDVTVLEPEQLLPRGAGALADTAFAAALLAHNTLRGAAQVVRRRAVDRRLAALPAGVEPRLWVGICAGWVQPSRHLLDAVVAPLERAHVPYGILFE